MMNRQQMHEQLQKKLSKNRYLHSLGVAYTAASMAMRYDVEVNLALTAGLLHDCAKFLSDDEKIKKCQKHHLSVNEIEMDNPDLLHAKLSAHYACKKYGVTNPEILSAIAYHTTGRANMTTLEKIIYVADYIEPNRMHLPDIEYIRKEAFEDLDQCFIYILKNSIAYLLKEGYTCHNISMEAYEYYIGG